MVFRSTYENDVVKNVVGGWDDRDSDTLISLIKHGGNPADEEHEAACDEVIARRKAELRKFRMGYSFSNPRKKEDDYDDERDE